MRRCLSAVLLLLMFVGAGCNTARQAPEAGQNGTPINRSQGPGGVNRPEHLSSPYVILVGLDGFRHDYFERYDTPNFDRIIRKGVRAEGLIPVFPSLTFPNHMSIVTGMRPDRHGIVANRFYDPQRDKSYVYVDSMRNRDPEWYTGEPIWVTAERQGMVAATYFWPGSEAAIYGVRPTYWKRYDGSVRNSDRVDQVLEWLQLSPEKRPHFITLYLSDVDHAGHSYGPETPEVRAAVEEVDLALGRLLDGIERLPIADRLYFVLVSDHGMSEVGPETYIELDDVLDRTGVHVEFNSAVANVYVEGEGERARAVRDSINAALMNGRAFLREEIPNRLSYGNNPLVGDIVIIMDDHYVVGPQRTQPFSVRGMHGYDPALPSMQGIFVVTGPDIAEGKTIPVFENLHIYSFMAEILGLTPNPDIDGQPRYLFKQVRE